MSIEWFCPRVDLEPRLNMSMDKSMEPLVFEPRHLATGDIKGKLVVMHPYRNLCSVLGGQWSSGVLVNKSGECDPKVISVSKTELFNGDTPWQLL